MNTKRRSRIKHKTKERTRFYLELRKAKKQEFIFGEIKRRQSNQLQGRLVSFLFTGAELGLPESRYVSVRTAGVVLKNPRGEPLKKNLGDLTKEHLKDLREQVLYQTLAKLSAQNLDLSGLTTVGDSNETKQD